MRAHRISRHGGPEVLEWLELPDSVPRADEVLVRIRACALNHLDLCVRRGIETYQYPLPVGDEETVNRAPEPGPVEGAD